MPTSLRESPAALTTVAPVISVSNTAPFPQLPGIASAAPLEALMIVEPEAGDVLAAHEGGARRLPHVLDDIAQARRPIGLAHPARMDADGQHPAAGLIRLANHVVDGAAAVLGEVVWIAVAGCDEIAAVVERLGVGDNEYPRALVIEEVGQVVVARVGVVEKAALANQQVTRVHAREGTAVPARRPLSHELLIERHRVAQLALL